MGRAVSQLAGRHLWPVRLLMKLEDELENAFRKAWDFLEILGQFTCMAVFETEYVPDPAGM